MMIVKHGYFLFTVLMPIALFVILVAVNSNSSLAFVQSKPVALSHTITSTTAMKRIIATTTTRTTHQSKLSTQKESSPFKHNQSDSNKQVGSPAAAEGEAAAATPTIVATPTTEVAPGTPVESPAASPEAKEVVIGLGPATEGNPPVLDTNFKAPDDDLTGMYIAIGLAFSIGLGLMGAAVYRLVTAERDFYIERKVRPPN